MVNDAVYEKIMASREEDPASAAKTAKIVGLAALKYGDLSNQATKDYIFDPDRFTSFEGNTGPYILYTIVRIKSILNKYRETYGEIDKNASIGLPTSNAEKNLMLKISGFHDMVEMAFRDLAPHVVCRFVYELADAFNGFYHDTKILTEEDATKRESWIALLDLTRALLETGIDLLGFSAPERM